MTTFLDTIVSRVREEIGIRRQKSPPSLLRDRPAFHLPTRDLAGSLRGTTRHIIAEVKRASPSKGLIRKDFDSVKIARALSANGASALSVLTEEHFFQGSIHYLEEIKREVHLPLLRKDFMLDEYQLLEARSYGADAVLFIVALLDQELLRDLLEQARALSLQALVEVHNEEELECALKAHAQMIGINNRDLRTFEVNLATAETLIPKVPTGVTLVCESGIDSPSQMKKIEDLGTHVFLIGEALMRAQDPGAKLRELLS